MCDQAFCKLCNRTQASQVLLKFFWVLLYCFDTVHTSSEVEGCEFCDPEITWKWFVVHTFNTSLKELVMIFNSHIKLKTDTCKGWGECVVGWHLTEDDWNCRATWITSSPSDCVAHETEGSVSGMCMWWRPQMWRIGRCWQTYWNQLWYSIVDIVKGCNISQSFIDRSHLVLCTPISVYIWATWESRSLEQSKLFIPLDFSLLVHEMFLGYYN